MQDAAHADVNCLCQALPSTLGLTHKTQMTPETRTVLHAGPAELTLSSQLSQTTCMPLSKR